MIYMIQSISFAAFVKALCMAGNVLVQVSPFPQIRRWEHRGCTGEADAAPYVSIAFGGWQWCFYGAFAFIVTKRSGFLILVHSNCLGALLGTYYAIAFWKNCRNESSRNSFQLYLSSVGSLVVLQACSIAVLPAERALFLTGLVSSFCSFVGALSMLVTVPDVIRIRDSRSLPGALCVANFASAMVWCVCGWMLRDPLVACPNIACCCASAVCMYLKLKYPSFEDEKTGDCATEIETIKNAHSLESGERINEFTPIAPSVQKKLVLKTPQAVKWESCGGSGGTF